MGLPNAYPPFFIKANNMTHQTRQWLTPLMLLLLVGCSSMAMTRPFTYSEVSRLKPAVTTYEQVVAKYGDPQQVTENGDELRVAYMVDETESTLSNIDGKAFVRGVGGSVMTYKNDSRMVTLLFDKNTRLYKGREQLNEGL